MIFFFIFCELMKMYLLFCSLISTTSLKIFKSSEIYIDISPFVYAKFSKYPSHPLIERFHIFDSFDRGEEEKKWTKKN